MTSHGSLWTVTCAVAGMAALGTPGCSAPAPKPEVAGPAPAASDGQADRQARAAGATDPNAVYGPLLVGADYQKSFHKVSTQPFESATHGHRFVEVWVNDVGLSSYQSEAEMPPGSVVVKESWERDGNRPSKVRGPLFVMEKREKGFDPEHDDWRYEFHWAEVPVQWQGRLGKQVYWRSPSAKVDYCVDCHDNYDRELGMVPRGFRTWENSPAGAAPP